MRPNNKERLYFYSLMGLFLILVSVGVFVDYRTVFVVAPVIGILYLSVYKLEKLILWVVFLTPLSIKLSEIIKVNSINMQLPTEPIIFGLMLMFLIKFSIRRKEDFSQLNHPISYAIGFYLIWILITSLTSTMPVVSFKYFASKLWYIIVFFFAAVPFLTKKSNTKKFLIFYCSGLSLVIIYTIANLYITTGSLLDQKAAHSAMSPFFNDHTSFGASLSMFIPVVINYTFNPIFKGQLKKTAPIVLILLLTGLIFSYSRASWVSLAGAFIIWLLIKFRVKWRIVLLLIATGVVTLFINYSSIELSLEKNKQDSSSDMVEHVRSISNISTDASNLERINRWKCAWRMFIKKPIVGYGPGTYMFSYAPFQKGSEKTIISTNRGDGGNAHNELLGALSETGMPGALSLIIIVILYSIHTIRLYFRMNNRKDASVLLATFIGMTTYFIHAFLNNFLDIDKIAVPFWAFMALALTYNNSVEAQPLKKLYNS